MPRSRILVIALASALVLVGTACAAGFVILGGLERIGWLSTAWSGEDAGEDAAAAPADWAPPAAVPMAATAGSGYGDGITARVDADWVAVQSGRTGIPERVLAAYAGAALAKQGELPSCGLSWSTLAGVGWVESRHASYDGNALDERGTAQPGIFGVALAGDGTAHIPDSDGGRIDGDADYDRAVGPMQMIPEAWRNWGTDGSGDGRADPQNIDDAVLSAANYLCRSGEDLSGERGWRVAIASYNSADSYAGLVAEAGTGYGDAAGR
ncbi:lytic transglycosylase domain-containing protein [Homoserinibacter sp. YIM 151385]|uniref:lytic transglycosylase domain-containing protein n=1 Tax=Homoserinibacter sp. YIM 151385 TaxID=2985506 RepID=UPI0022EFF13D|nr:lytic murein transglycosylase [Homoserinibacter sp. YIM 151385]WBU36981.1 lytic murein transglycosylase [Homoserinibacter sp. YIM 151385]